MSGASVEERAKGLPALLHIENQQALGGYARSDILGMFLEYADRMAPV